MAVLGGVKYGAPTDISAVLQQQFNDGFVVMCHGDRQRLAAADDVSGMAGEVRISVSLFQRPACGSDLAVFRGPLERAAAAVAHVPDIHVVRHPLPQMRMCKSEVVDGADADGDVVGEMRGRRGS